MAQNSNLALMDPSNMPGLEPPPGVIPNLVNPKDELFTWWILMMCMCSISSTIFVFVRMYTKLALVKSHGWEDCECAEASYCTTNTPGYTLANRSSQIPLSWHG